MATFSENTQFCCTLKIYWVSISHSVAFNFHYTCSPLIAFQYSHCFCVFGCARIINIPHTTPRWQDSIWPPMTVNNFWRQAVWIGFGCLSSVEDRYLKSFSSSSEGDHGLKTTAVEFGGFLYTEGWEWSWCFRKTTLVAGGVGIVEGERREGGRSLVRKLLQGRRKRCWHPKLRQWSCRLGGEEFNTVVLGRRREERAEEIPVMVGVRNR